MLGIFQRARRKVQARLAPYRAVLGDDNNNPYAGDGLYWVRPYDAMGPNGVAKTGAAYRVRAGVALIVPRGGRVVWVGYGLDLKLTVLGYDHDDLVAAGINPTSVQPNDPYREWIRFKNIQNFRALPIGTGNTPSMKVQVRQLIYQTATGDMVLWNGTNADTHVDLTDYVPGTGLQRYVVLWLRAYNPNGLNDIQVTSSSAISSVNDVLSFDELQECADAADADTIPIQAFRLANAQTALKIDDTTDEDLRQFINMPQVYGFPNTVRRAYRIHEEFSVVAPSAIDIEDGGLIQIQDDALLVILGEEEAASGGSGGSSAPTDAKYLIQTANAGLPNAQAMGALGNGLVKNTTGTGVQSIAVAGTDYTTPTGTENLSNKTITASSLIATALSLIIGGFRGILTHANTADRTYTLPNYNATLSPMTTQGDLVYFNGTDNTRLPKGTALQHLRMNAGATAPEWANGVTLNLQTFTGNGTYTKPTGAFEIRVICVGGGGGGGSGKRDAGGTVRGGGGGGGAGYVVMMTYDAAQITSTVSVTVGAGGPGGAAVTTNTTDGAAGGPGGGTSFGGYLYAAGGGGGGGGTAVAGTAGVGATTLSRNFQFYGSNGGAGGAAGGGNGVGATPAGYGPGGGGGGGTITAGGTASGGGGGASAQVQAFGIASAGTGGTPGTVVSPTGGNGAAGVISGSSAEIFGAGGGGGLSGATGSNGGNGGLPGGGGGGGGGSLNGNLSGAGGNGGDGAVIVITYCWA